MSKIGNWVLEQEDAGNLEYVEGRGYVKPEDYASEYMKTEQFKKEFDEAFGNPIQQIDNIIDNLNIKRAGGNNDD